MGFQVKRSVRAVLTGFLCMAMVLGIFTGNVTPAQAASDAVINLSTKHQEIRGFGGMNHPSWAGDLTASQRETAFGNGDLTIPFKAQKHFNRD